MKPTGFESWDVTQGPFLFLVEWWSCWPPLQVNQTVISKQVLEMSGWVPSSDIFNLWIDGQWKDLVARRRGGVQDCENCVSLCMVLYKAPPSPVHLSIFQLPPLRLSRLSFLPSFVSCSPISLCFIFHACLTFQLWGIFDFCFRSQYVLSSISLKIRGKVAGWWPMASLLLLEKMLPATGYPKALLFYFLSCPVGRCSILSCSLINLTAPSSWEQNWRSWKARFGPHIPLESRRNVGRGQRQQTMGP